MGAAVKVSRLLVNDIDCNFWTLAYFCIAVIVSYLAADLAVLRLPHSSDFGNEILHGLFSKKRNKISMALYTCSVKRPGLSRSESSPPADKSLEYRGERQVSD